MSPEEELELVKKAIVLAKAVCGCCEWDDRAMERVQLDADLAELTPAAIRKLTIEFVVAGGIIQQVKEQRPEYNDFDFYYKAIVPVPEFPHGLFVEFA
jgi:hypothetical protein